MKQYEVSMYPDMGRGVKALVDFLPGDEVMRCEILVLSPQDTKIVNTTELQYYTFSFNDLQDCLVLGDGEIFNHADQANVKYHLDKSSGRSQMVFTATETITSGEQLFIDYSADVLVEVDGYLNNGSLIK